MPSNADHSLVLLSSIREAVALKEKCDSKTVRDLIPPSQQSCVLCDTFLSGPRVTVHAVYVEVLGSLPLMPVIQLALPKGLVVVEDCISKGEEHSLLQILSGDREDVGFDKEKKRDHLKLRRVEHYGYKFEYGSNNVDPEKPLSVPIPKLLYDILKRMLEQKIISYFPDQLTVNEYQAGQGIPPHVDTHSAFEGEIISLSLGSH
jgi:alkylated DNA repair protein alkB family protein 8